MSVNVQRNASRMHSAVRQTLYCSLLLLLVSGGSAQRKRIAVLSFDVGATAKQHAQSQFGIQDDLGRVLSDVLVDRLVQDGKFIVIERTALDKVLKEQNFSNSDRADPSTAARIGKLAGVDAIVIGGVTEFGLETKETAFGGATSHISFGGLSKIERKNSTVSVATTARLVDVNTGAIIASATGAGQSTKTQTSAGGVGDRTGAGFSQKSSDFNNPMVAEATEKAIASMSMQLEAEVAAMPPPPPVARQSYAGVVADVSGNTLILTIGTVAGVRVGDTVEISRPVRTIKNPQTGAVLKVVSDRLGAAKITEVDANSATAVLDAPASVKVNDQVNSAP